jgi:hypothetical protein
LFRGCGSSPGGSSDNLPKERLDEKGLLESLASGSGSQAFFAYGQVRFSKGINFSSYSPELKGKEVVAGGHGKRMSKGLNSERRKRK